MCQESVISNCETIFDGNKDSPPQPITGVSLAFRITPSEFTYSYAIELLQSYEYIAIDEIKGMFNSESIIQ